MKLKKKEKLRFQIESPKFCALADFLDENEIPIVEKFSEKPIDQ